MSNNAAERAIRPLALGRRSRLFAGSDRGGRRAAATYTLIGTAKLNNFDSQAWLADMLARIAGTPRNRLQEPLPWNWHEDGRSLLRKDEPKSGSWLPVRLQEALVDWGHERIERGP